MTEPELYRDAALCLLHLQVLKNLAQPNCPYEVSRDKLTSSSTGTI
jgi:hypothetical protein